MPAPAQEYPQVIHVMTIAGMNDRDQKHVLADQYCAYIQNMDISRPGARTRRLGVSPIGGRSDTPQGMFSRFDLGPGQETIFEIHGGKLYNFQGGGYIVERACGVSLTDSLHLGVEGRIGNRLCTYIVQAGDNDSSYTLCSRIVAIDDAGNFTQATGPAFKAACWFQNRIWGGPDAYGNQSYETLWWSELGAGMQYSALNTLQIEPGVGGNITGLYPLRGVTPTIVVFKQRAIASLEPHWGSTSNLIPASADALDVIKTNVRLIAQNVGTEAPGSIQFVPGAPGGDIYFLSREGVRALNRASDDTVSGVTAPVSDNIKATIDRINFTYARKCVSAVYDDKYFLGVPLDGATECTHTIVIDLKTGGCHVETWSPKAFTVAKISDTTGRLWMQYNTITLDCSNTAAASAYHTYKCFSGSQDPGSVPVDFYEESRGFHFNTIDIKKRWDYASLTFRNDATYTATIGVMYNVDQKGWVTAGSGVYGPVADNSNPIMGLTPLPWGVAVNATRTYKFSLNDAEPGYLIQIRYFGVSDWSLPAILDMAVAARPVLKEYDNTIT